ncbi:MAG TPA: PTS sugar transporter subunit IIA [Candidatus Hydrogenedentes bacterium]|nr:PTS sugar transporter subunit IIA [Candidatus Hydrogenedentota bacterium]HNT87041.1 PTS sugar transporter subunit IIA [Candidatus Hydrogenedentota bacterium]
MSLFGVHIPPSNIRVIPPGQSKHDALDLLISAVARSGAVADHEVFQRAVHEREAVMSTGIGGGVAIPHVRIPEVRYATIGVGVAPDGIEYGTLDNNPVHILVLFAMPEGADKEYLRLLAQVMAALKNQEVYDRLVACRTAKEVHAVLEGAGP